MPTSSKANVQWEYYKTRLCQSVGSGSPCPYGPRCVFAHKPSEVRPNKDHTLIANKQQSTTTEDKPIQWEHYKTRLCRTYGSGTVCSFGDRCMYAHSMEELRTKSKSLIPPSSSIPSSSVSSSACDSKSIQNNVSMMMAAPVYTAPLNMEAPPVNVNHPFNNVIFVPTTTTNPSQFIFPQQPQHQHPVAVVGMLQHGLHYHHQEYNTTTTMQHPSMMYTVVPTAF